MFSFLFWFFSFFFSLFFLLPHFIALPLTATTNISGDVPFLSLVPVRRPSRLSRSTHFGDVAKMNGGEVAWHNDAKGLGMQLSRNVPNGPNGRERWEGGCIRMPINLES